MAVQVINVEHIRLCICATQLLPLIHITLQAENGFFSEKRERYIPRAYTSYAHNLDFSPLFTG